MADGIEFGEVEEVARERKLRPDQNRHYGVAACGRPIESDLPVYVDLDVMRDMESHALTDTSVELGGVMLGGQYEDEDGKPFVLITDSLRAQHYEATKGSFKFTHDTWEKISRERDEFPEDLQMVGWYHTHPDWGVFLSGMDMFICDNFFNKELDVALVIDPCRDDRGWFQWTGNPSERVRRTEGFYLIASRFRQRELQQYAAVLEGQAGMSIDPRRHNYPEFAQSPAPVVNISQRQPAWQGAAVLGMLASQFLLLVVLAWKLMVPVAEESKKVNADAKRYQALAKRLDHWMDAEQETRENKIQARVLDEVIAGLQKDIPAHERINNAATDLANERNYNARLVQDLRLYQASEQRLHDENEKLAKNLKSTTATLNDYRSNKVPAKNKEIAALKQERDAIQDKYEDLQKEQKEKNAVWMGLSASQLWLYGGGLLFLIVTAVFIATIRRNEDDYHASHSSREPRRPEPRFDEQPPEEEKKETEDKTPPEYIGDDE